MRRNAITAAACIAALLTAGAAAAQTAPPCGTAGPSTVRPQVSQDGLTWEVRYLLDTSQCPGGVSQYDSPRSNRGVGVSPDGRFIYLGYNEPNGAQAAGHHDHQVRMIDTLVEDFTDSIVTILNRHRGKSITVDDKGRVYLAEGSDTDVHGGAGGIHIFDGTLTTEIAVIPIGATYGLAKPEGVTTKREAGVLALYVTDRTTKKLYRLVISEAPSGVGITGITKSGLFTGTGEVPVPGAADLRGVKIEPAVGGRIWMADLTGNKVYRCEADGSLCMTTAVTKPMDIGLLGLRAFVTQFTSPVPPTITVLRQSDMGFDSLIVPPWAPLRLDPLGQKMPVPNGPFLGNLSGVAAMRLPNGDKVLYFSNERGQTELEKSTYGRCDQYSDNPGGNCFFTDTTIDDNEPAFKIYEPNRRIGDFVWIDSNGNGIQDAGEPGIPGVTVTLTGPLGTLTTTTDANGLYQFNDLIEGTYTVTVATPAGYTPSPSNAPGSTPANDSNGSPTTVTLGPGVTQDLTIDFGFVPPATGTLGDFVWSDLNGNGIQDAGEPGIANVTVTLTGPGGPQTALTDGTGFYQFSNLSAGTYTVTVATPAGTTPSPSNAPGSTPANDSNGSPALVTLPTNSSSDQTIDFGFVPPPTGKLGDFVWNDLNGNGIQDAGEPGIPGVTVTLMGPGGPQTTVTDATGFYQFTNLSSGTYSVIVPTPTGYAATPSNAPGSTPANDSNGSPAMVTLATNSSSDQTIDFGFIRLTGSIGDFVWDDLNHNGIQDTGEPGLPGVTVTLTGPGGPQTTVTSATGFYQFTNLGAGTYTVTVTPPAGYSPTTSNAPGSTPANDSNGSPATVTLATNSSSDQTIDFGYVKPLGSIGDFVWSDLNGNGIQDAGEPGIAGVTVTLSGPGGPQTTTTDASGFYQFTNLLAGTYTVTVATPAGTTPSPNSAPGSTPANDSNGSPATVTLPTNSSSDQTIDFGFVPPPTGKLGDFVWNDLNRNGIQDAGEPGIAGITVTLTGPGGPQTTVTDASGFYQFTNLSTGTYTVSVPTPAGFAPTPSNAPGSTPANDSNGSPATVTLPTNGSTDQTIDFGFVRLGSIGDFVWNDLNANGIQDAGEPGLAGVSVTLTGPGGPQSTVTDASGFYQFTNLVAGTYTVTVGTPAGFSPTTNNAPGSTPANDSNGSPATVTLPVNGSSDATIDFGFVKPLGSIGDFVWSDLNGNGIQDAGEPGISGVTVTLSGPGGPQTTTTNASGFYQFTNLLAGTYTVTVATPAGTTPSPSNAPGSTPANDSNGSPATATLPTNTSSDQTIDFGFVPPATGKIGDFVWSDLNGNGIQDSGEPGIAGVVVTLTGPGGPQTTTTNASGFYQFINLSAGTYTVTVTPPAGSTPSPTNAPGSTTANDSNGNPSTVTLPTNSSTNFTIDFGYIPPPPLTVMCPPNSGTVGVPYSGSAVASGGVPPYTFSVATGALPPGLMLNTATGAITGTPTAAGSYTFTIKVTDATGASATSSCTGCGGGTVTWNFNMPQGVLGPVQTYTVNGIPITAYGFSNAGAPKALYGKNDGGDESGLGIYATSADNEIDVNNFVQLDLQNVITSGATNAQMAIGSVQAGETYNIYGSNTLGTIGTLLGTANRTLDSTPFPIPNFGTYRYVSVRASNADVLLMSVSFTIPAGCIITIAPATVPPTGTIGDFVWSDLNGNGIQDAGEPGIAGVTVTLNGPGGPQTTTTNASGLYQFNNLVAGTYTVTVVPPAGTTPSPSNASGSTPANDSNANPATVTLPTNSSSDQTIDFGFVPPPTGKIGDFVWNDLNGNGIQDAGEPGIAGITVTLNGPGGTRTTTTSASGAYLFSNLLAGTYTVTVGTPSGFTPSPSHATGSTAANDSNGSPAMVTLATNSSTDLTIDFGYVPQMVCTPTTFTFTGNTATYGTAGNIRSFTSGGVSVKASGFSRVDGVGGAWSTAYLGLYGPGLGVTDGSEGDGSGNRHKVDNIGGRNNYVLFEFSTPVVINQAFLDYIGADSDMAVWIGNTADPYNNHITLNDAVLAGFTREDNDTTSTTTSRWADVNASSRSGNVIIIAASVTDTTPDDEFKISKLLLDCPPTGPPPTGSIGDYVWNDLNANGIQDAGEPGLPGVTVQLKNSAGTVIQTDVTDGVGFYQFNGLVAGSYTVVVATPSGFTASPSNVGTNRAIDSNGSAAPVTLATNSSSDQTIDFGFVPQLVCTPTTFTFSGNSPTSGTAGNVRMFTAGGVSVKATAFSRVDGTGGAWNTAYLGLYGPGLGVTDGSEGDGANPKHKVDNIGGRNNYVLFEFSTPVIIDQAFLDYIGADSDMSVWIGNTADPYNNHITLNDAVLAGFAREDNDTTVVATSRWADLNASGRMGNILIIAASASDTTPDDEFKISKLLISCPPNGGATGTIGNFVWKDVNGNGIQDAGEPGLSGVTVQLKNSAGTVIQTTTTDAAGSYLFTTVAAGTYTVVVSAPSGYTVSPSFAAGSTTANDSNGSPATVTLATSSSNDLTIDFGFVPPPSGTIGDFVWSDLNGNGLQDAGEPGLSGVTVQLKNSGGTVIQTTTTSSSGYYQFTGLAAGSYTVVVATPASFTTSPSNVGTNRAIDSNGSPAAVTLATSSSSDLTIDVGFIPQMVCTPTTFSFTGSTATSGTPGNVRLFTSGSVSVKASGFSRVDGTGGAWSTAYLGAYPQGLGVTDASEGDGSNNRHKVDNMGGRNNYVLFEFSSPVVVNQAFLDYIGADSDMAVWIGTKTDPFNNHLTLSDALLATLVREDNDTTATTTSRWADVNASGRSGNVVIIAASVTDTTPDDEFKISKLLIDCVSSQTALSLAGVVTTGKVGVAYSSNAVASGGTQPYVFSIASGALPAGLTLNAGTGLVSGTPTTAGSYTVTLKVTAANGATATAASTIVIAAASTGYTTYTQGSWGVSTTTAGTLLKNKFTTVYSVGYVYVGSSKYLAFTTATGVDAFLSQGGTPGILATSAVNATGSAAGSLAGELLALQLNVDFSNAGITKAGLGNLVVKTGLAAGMTVAQVLDAANDVLGGDYGVLSADMMTAVNEVITAINNNFNGGTVNQGYLQ